MDREEAEAEARGLQNPVGWIVYGADSTDDYHIMPINDLREHIEGRDCWCDPREDDEYLETTGRFVLVHNSADRREHTYETGWMH